MAQADEILRYKHALHLGREEPPAADTAGQGITGKPRVVWVEATEARASMVPLWRQLDTYVRELARGEFDAVTRAFPGPVGGVRHPGGWLLSAATGLAVAADMETDADLIIFNDWAMPVHEARSLLSVPVTGISEASVVLGNVLARHPAIVTVAEGLNAGLERDMRSFGLWGRGPQPAVWWLDPPSTHDDVVEAIENPARLIARFDEVAHRAVAAGADAILTGCGYFGPVFSMHDYFHVSGRPDIPVYDCTALGMEFGRLLYRLDAAGVQPSRRGFPKMQAEARQAADFLMAHILTMPGRAGGPAPDAARGPRARLL
jgi:allantoin racemase